MAGTDILTAIPPTGVNGWRRDNETGSGETFHRNGLL